MTTDELQILRLEIGALGKRMDHLAREQSTANEQRAASTERLTALETTVGKLADTVSDLVRALAARTVAEAAVEKECARVAAEAQQARVTHARESWSWGDVGKAAAILGAAASGLGGLVAAALQAWAGHGPPPAPPPAP